MSGANLTDDMRTWSAVTGSGSANMNGGAIASESGGSAVIQLPPLGEVEKV